MSDEVYDPYDLSNYTNPKFSKNKKENNLNDEEEALGNGISTDNKKNHIKRKMTDDEELPDELDLTKNAYENNKEEENEDNKNDNSDLLNEDEDIPLLEDLGVNMKNIKQKIISILTLRKIDKTFFDESDQAGPFFIICVFALTLVLQKKTCFGYLYGISVIGSILVFLLLNLMSKNESILLYDTISILGYNLIPIVLLSVLKIIIHGTGIFTNILCIFVILFSSLSATRFFETALEMQNQRFLIFYPVALFYTCFVLVTVT